MYGRYTNYESNLFILLFKKVHPLILQRCVRSLPYLMSRCSPSNKPAIGSKWYRDVNNYTSNRKPLVKTLSTVAVIKHDYCILSDINNATLSEKKITFKKTSLSFGKIFLYEDI